MLIRKEMMITMTSLSGLKRIWIERKINKT